MRARSVAEQCCGIPVASPCQTDEPFLARPAPHPARTVARSRWTLSLPPHAGGDALRSQAELLPLAVAGALEPRSAPHRARRASRCASSAARRSGSSGRTAAENRRCSRSSRVSFSRRAAELRVDGTIAPLIELGVGFDARALARRQHHLLRRAARAPDDSWCAPTSTRFSTSPSLPITATSRPRFSRRGWRRGLSFAIATEFRPEILLVDEVLSVGDERFRRKCSARIDRFWDEHSTIVLVSHDMLTIAPDVQPGHLARRGPRAFRRSRAARRGGVSVDDPDVLSFRRGQELLDLAEAHDARRGARAREVGRSRSSTSFAADGGTGSLDRMVRAARLRRRRGAARRRRRDHAGRRRRRFCVVRLAFSRDEHVERGELVLLRDRRARDEIAREQAHRIDGQFGDAQPFERACRLRRQPGSATT